MEEDAQNMVAKKAYKIISNITNKSLEHPLKNQICSNKSSKN